MKRDSEDERIISYLLGQLSAEEQSDLEDRYLTDRACFEQVCAIEDELIEDYLSGALPERMRRQFDKSYLASPERYKRVKLATDLRETLKLQQLSQGRPELAATVPPVRSQRTRGVFSLVLFPGLVRDVDEGPTSLVIGPLITEIILDLDLNAAVDEFTSYLATLKSVQGETVFSQDGLGAKPVESGFRVRMGMPASLLGPGDYSIHLHGFTAAGLELIDIYYFHVTGEEPGMGSSLSS